MKAYDVKFRVWYPRSNRFYYLAMTEIDYVLSRDAWNELHDVQFFTGYYTSNKKPIYDGDYLTLVHKPSTEPMMCLVSHDGKKYILTNSYNLNPIPMDRLLDPNVVSSVTGNIYEKNK